MRPIVPVLVVWLALASHGMAQTPPAPPAPVPIPVPAPKLEVVGDVVQVVRSLPVTVKAPAGADLYLWRHASAIESNEMGDTLEITKAPAGVVKVSVQMLRIDWETKRFQTTVAVAELQFGPPPKPPGPEPSPNPQPDPPPFPATGLTVLILEETESRNTLPKSQLEQLSSQELRDWARAHCQTLGGSPALRIWDDDLPISGDVAKDWGAAAAKAKSDSSGKRPWVIVSNGTSGASQPLPDTLEETLTLLSRFKK